MNATLLINTWLQLGVRTNGERENRFNGFSRATETVETVSALANSNHPAKAEMTMQRFNHLTI
jgi:hypothetical protein